IIPIEEQKEYVILTLYITLPKSLPFIPFFFASYYICVQKTRALGRFADVLWALTLISYLLLVSLSIKNADFSAFLPVNYHNTKNIISGSYHALSWFGDGVYLLFLIGEFEWEKKSFLKIMLSYLTTFFLILIFSFLFYCIFSSIAFRQRFAMTEISKYSSVINSTGRFDYIGIGIILLVNVFAVSLPLFFACKIMQELFNIKKNWVCALIVNIFAFIFSYTLESQFYYIEQFIINYVGILFFILGNVFPIILTLMNLGEKNEICKN
ncbi:MAG: GerAB/ArcD/ProY family transporter, partial [Firmicutes bacterium]|nr:GerAB/ArcD/ProY family transporter [Candidatus Caballimonas caccae]